MNSDEVGEERREGQEYGAIGLEGGRGGGRRRKESERCSVAGEKATTTAKERRGVGKGYTSPEADLTIGLTVLRRCQLSSRDQFNWRPGISSYYTTHDRARHFSNSQIESHRCI